MLYYTERTYRKAPSNPPTSVFVKGINPSTIKVVWRYVTPNNDEEPVKGFKVSELFIHKDREKFNFIIFLAIGTCLANG